MRIFTCTITLSDNMTGADVAEQLDAIADLLGHMNGSATAANVSGNVKGGNWRLAEKRNYAPRQAKPGTPESV